MPVKMISVEEEYGKCKDLKREDVGMLMDWASKQPHLPKVSELQVILFLHSCFYSIEAAKVTIDNYYTVRTHCPEFFTNRDPNGAMKTDMDLGLYSRLPTLTPEGYQVILLRLMNYDPTNWGFTEMLKLFTLVVDLGLLKNGTTTGHVIVFDMDGVTFGHFTKLGPLVVKKYLYYLQEAMPVRLKGLHFVNIVPFMDKILALIKPFMKKQLLEILHVHADSVEGLSKHVPKAVLPKELGGEAPTFKELHDTMKQEIIYSYDYFKDEEKDRVDESKRPGKAKDVGDLFGVEGTFKKLDLD